jgi:hypothetical protein
MDMGKVGAFHTDTVLAEYHPRERYVYHNQSECGYGKRVMRDGNDKPGPGTKPDGTTRDLCDRCEGLA